MQCCDMHSTLKSSTATQSKCPEAADRKWLRRNFLGTFENSIYYPSFTQKIFYGFPDIDFFYYNVSILKDFTKILIRINTAVEI